MAALWPSPPRGLVEANVQRRQVESLEQGAAVLQELTEPWRGDPRAETVLEDCLLLHLYARVLDDVLDEGLPLHRTMLLRMQPLMWRSIQGLSLAAPALSGRMNALVDQEIQAVQTEHDGPRPEAWAAKNYHLLLAPMVLSNNDSSYQAAAPDLERFLLVLQAQEELEQLAPAWPEPAGPEVEQLLALVETEWVTRLSGAGWNLAVQRLLGELPLLISRLKERIIKGV